MKDFVNRYGHFKIHSQQGEEGICIEAFKRLGVVRGNVCEFGAHNGSFCSNSRYWLDKGWHGLLIEADRYLYRDLITSGLDHRLVKCKREFVSPENVNELLEGIEFDLLSIDTDSNDYEIWKAYQGKPKVVIIEIDSCIPPAERKFNRHGGAGYLPMVELGIQKGYFLLCHTGNLVFIDQQYWEKFPEIKEDPITNPDEYFNKSWLHLYNEKNFS